MKIKIPISIIVILSIGAILTVVILNMNRSSVDQSLDFAKESQLNSEALKPNLKGEHGGWLFTKDNIQVEVKIYEKGIPPQFRVYVTDSNGDAIDLNEVGVHIQLHRLHRTDKINFKPIGEYLQGDKIIVEPHSFEMKIKVQWQGKVYEWEISQIEARTTLPDEAIVNAGISFSNAGPAKLKHVLRLAGEIGLNQEKVVHIVPRLDGVVKKVFKDLGQKVNAGEIIAILESRELADAKINYLGAVKNADLAKIDLDRETLLVNNTSRMLDLLEKKLELEVVYRALENLIIGESRELLIPAYAKLKLTQSVYLREKKLFAKGISSQSEFLLAEEDFKSAEARYIALREKIAYDGSWALRQKKRTLEMEKFNLQTTRQKLFALGLTKVEVKDLIYQEENIFTQHELRSPLRGIVINKHLAIGEAVKKDDDVFVLADFSDVWVNISIPAKDLKNVKIGQEVSVVDDNSGLKAKGKLTYLGSIVDEKTRMVTGRVVIANPDRRWSPGSFIRAELVLEEKNVPIAVPLDAIQTIRDWSVVFVKYGNQYEARPLTLGKNDGENVAVLEGLLKGERYVSGNSFTVKAEIEKSTAAHSH